MDYHSYKYIVVIDESGNSAYQNLGTETGYGPCDYLIIGAVLFKKEKIIDIKNILNDIQEIRNGSKFIHMTGIRKNITKRYIFRKLSKLNMILAFSVVSNKKTLSNGQYKNYNPKNHWKYYHKNVQYILEKISNYMNENNINKDEIIFIIEENPSVKISSLRTFISSIKKDNYAIRRINENNIRTLSKNEEPLLFLADAVAHSLYKAIVPTYFNGEDFIETVYFDEIKNLFYKKNKICDEGIKFIHSIQEIPLNEKSREYFLNIDA